MTKILHMAKSRGQASADPAHYATDPLEPTRPLSSRNGDSPFPLPLPIVRPWFPAPLVLRQRPQDLPRIA